MIEQAAQIVALVLGIMALLTNFGLFILWIPSKFTKEREDRTKMFGDLSSRIAVLELRSSDDKQLEAALDKAFARALRPIESRLEGVERGFSEASAEMHRLIVELAVLKDREGGVDYREHNERTVGKAARG